MSRIKFKKTPKYFNKKIKNEFGTFDSEKEYKVFLELRNREKFGEIKNLQHTVTFDLLPTIKTGKKTYRKIVYKADFVYEENGEKVVVDVKAFSKKKNKFITTKDFQLKKHMMLHFHGIEIQIR